jgi:cysteine desulfurase
MRIYLDYNAGAPLRPEVRAAIARFCDADSANPAAVHQGGQRARRALERARAQVARLIGADAREIVFTAGGTESNNLAIMGAVQAQHPARRIVTSSIEHSSILAPFESLARRGHEVVYVAPGREGRIAPDAVAEALDAPAALVSIAMANAEVGTIQEAAAMAEPVARAGALFHLDAAQAAGRMAVHVRDLRCDLMTLSGHKLGAPAGIGALYVREGVAIAPALLGGPQESGLRAGTPNLLGAVALGAAAEAVSARLEEESARVSALSERLLDLLRAAIPGLRLNGPPSNRIFNTLNLTFPGVLGESMLIALDLEGVEVSMGSACAAGAVEPSHVLLAMGLGRAAARSSLRLSLGWNTGAADIERAAETIARVWRRVRAAEPADTDAADNCGSRIADTSMEAPR